MKDSDRRVLTQRAGARTRSGATSPGGCRTSAATSTTRPPSRSSKPSSKPTTRTSGPADNRLFYLSTPPSVFSVIIDQSAESRARPARQPQGLDAHHRREAVRHRPRFGARAANRQSSKVFDEKQIYRIDHYLGKEPVQDIMALRFANMIFEPIWNRHYVDSRADHRGRDGRRRVARRLLRQRRRAARHDPEPRDQSARARRDGAARQLRRRRDPRREVQGALGAAPDRPDHDLATMRRAASTAPAASTGKPVPGLPRRTRRRSASRTPRPMRRSSSTSTTGAGPACRSTCAAASGSRARSRRSRSRSSRIPHRLFGEAGDTDRTATCSS